MFQRRHPPGAALIGAGTYMITLLGGLFVDHVVAGATAIYGSFAAIIGLLAWVSLLVQVLVYGNLVNVVRADTSGRAQPPAVASGEADRRAIDLTMRREALVS